MRLSGRVDAKQADVVAVDLDFHVVGQLNFFASPEVFGVLGAVEAELLEVQAEGMSGDSIAADVDDSDCFCATLQIAGPDFNLAATVKVTSLVAEWILVESDDVLVRQNVTDL